ncbi:hypothetical protein RvY_02506 [Ramazzottius varieornatus]|uniref:Uncharacterized protein n=1 Tax=Ramazzottius varieornatus TaxID=947166 RepID=A0A1D1US07_RAMVA|nr:hypothetical protein RvY_02506 [Ramazzottius varieornatus]
MSRKSSRSSSVTSRSTAIAEDDDELLADNLIAFHRLTLSFVLVQNPVDQKTRMIDFSSKLTCRNNMKCDRSKVAGETGLQVDDEIWAYFSPTQANPQGSYKAIVRGLYGSEAECKAAEKILKSKSSSTKKRKTSSARGRNA